MRYLVWTISFPVLLLINLVHDISLSIVKIAIKTFALPMAVMNIVDQAIDEVKEES